MSKAKRSKKLFRNNIKNDLSGNFDYLYQWDYSRKNVFRVGNSKHIGNSCKFISIVQKGNKFYIDKPYYIYSGQHKYRLLNNKISFFIKLYHINYKIHDFIKQVKSYIFTLIYKSISKVKKLTKNLFKSKEEKEFDKLFK